MNGKCVMIDTCHHKGRTASVPVKRPRRRHVCSPYTQWASWSDGPVEAKAGVHSNMKTRCRQSHKVQKNKEAPLKVEGKSQLTQKVSESPD